MDCSIGVEPWRSFGVELTGAIFFSRPLPGFGGISNFILKRKKLTKLMFSQHHFLVSSIDFYITSGSHFMPSGHCREYILHLTMASRWLHEIVKPSHTIGINIVCKTTTSCIVRECFGYNRVSIVYPSVCFVQALAQNWLFTKFVTKIARTSKFQIHVAIVRQNRLGLMAA